MSRMYRRICLEGGGLGVEFPLLMTDLQQVNAGEASLIVPSERGYMGDCQNYGPFFGPYYNTGPNTGPNLGDPKRDHNFDNHPYRDDEKEHGDHYLGFAGLGGLG